jgi:carboxypeptidase Taq
LEQALIAGELTAADVPAAWNQKMQQYLGITPPDAARGPLQDVHWSAGLIGYFTTYSLGNLYAAQFFEQASKDLGNLDQASSRGEFVPLLNWLREKIHSQGQSYTARQLVKRVTGSDLSVQPLLRACVRSALSLVPADEASD